MTSYQSLYRTWRPHRFSDMVGQEATRRMLKNQARTGHVAHAYLFCGSHGTGKTSAARIMALAINCENPQEGDPCLVCESCKNLSNETSLDLMEMDAASNSSVDNVRLMLSKTDYPPQFVKYKVYIIDEVHMLSGAAFNALLKTLEEPPPYMVFILATTEPQKLPATILSRCQRFDFGRIADAQVVGRLRQALPEADQAAEEALQLIASAAEGSMRDAWSLLDMCMASGLALSEETVREALGSVSQEVLFDFLDALARRDSADTLSQVNTLMRQGRDVQVFLRDFSAHLRQVLAVKLTGEPIHPVGDTMLQRLRQQANGLSEINLVRMLEKCMQAETDARWAATPRAVLEVFALRICQVDQEQDLSGILARLSQLESALAQGVHAVPRETPAPKPQAAPVKETPALEMPAPEAPALPIARRGRPLLSCPRRPGTGCSSAWARSSPAFSPWCTGGALAAIRTAPSRCCCRRRRASLPICSMIPPVPRRFPSCSRRRWAAPSPSAPPGRRLTRRWIRRPWPRRISPCSLRSLAGRKSSSNQTQTKLTGAMLRS